jgi:RNA polymerase sigma factor (sigma-70 family)
MATSQLSEAIQHLRRTVLLRDGAGMTDEQLLSDYISRRDEAALAALVHRHGPMVWGVCRRVLRNYHDAEDAFQATFLVFVRKAGSIASRELLANWLYGVAHQTALKARATAAKRKERERQMTEMPEPAVAEQDLCWRDLQPLLDDELSRLPDKYRAVIVLCDLEGKSRKEAARQLSVPEGTVAGQLARARVMLAKRLAQRGVTLSVGALAAILSQKVASAGVPTSVVASTLKATTLLAAGQAAAAGAISVKAAALTERVIKTMLVSKLHIATATLLVFAALLGGAGLIYQTQAAGPQKAAKKQAAATQGDKNDKQPKTVTTPKEGRIFFVRQKGVGVRNFAMVNPDGKGETSLEDGASFHAVSPDGRNVAYGGPVDEQSKGEIFLKAVGAEKPGESLGVQGTCWCWSPDGRSLAINTLRDNAYTHAIFDLKTKKAKPLPMPEVKAPEDAKRPGGHCIKDWSRDGKWLLTTCYVKDWIKADLYRVKSDGSEAKRIGQGMDGILSPDGKKVLYLGWKEDVTAAKARGLSAKARLFIADVDGGKPRQVSQESNGTFQEGGFCWSPDGKKIAYVWMRDRDPGQGWETFLMVMDADGKNANVVLSDKLTTTNDLIATPFVHLQWR